MSCIRSTALLVCLLPTAVFCSAAGVQNIAAAEEPGSVSIDGREQNGQADAHAHAAAQETPGADAGEVQPLVRGIWRPGKAELDVGQGLISALAPEWRKRMADKGIHPFGWYMVSLQSILEGGLTEGAAYAGLFDFGLELDMEKLAGHRGLTIHGSGSWTSGTNLTNDVGAFAPVNAVFSGDTLRFFELWVQKDSADESWSLRAGRISVGWEYGLDYDFFTTYLSAAFRLNVFALDANAVNFSVIPFSNWGARLRWTNDSWRVQASVMNGYPRDYADDSLRGVNIGFDPEEGMFFIAEATRLWGASEARGTSNSGLLPGRVTFGGYYDTGEFDELDGSGQTATGLGNLYVIGRQKVWEPWAGSENGIDLWSAVSYGGKAEIVPVSYFWSGGLVWNGPIPGRSNDTLALGWANSWFSDSQPGLTTETTLETAYSYEVNSWLDVMFDLQYIVNPGGSGTVDDAVIAGMLLYFTM
jgi:porin